MDSPPDSEATTNDDENLLTNVCPFEVDGLAAEKMRENCSSCQRPHVVCYCEYLPSQPLDLPSHLPSLRHILIFQHPMERKQAFATVRLLSLCCNPHSLTIVSTRKPERRHFGDLCRRIGVAISDEVNPLLLFPTPTSSPDSEYFPGERKLKELKASSRVSVLVVLDGTWHFARQMYSGSSWLQSIPSIHLTPGQCWKSSVGRRGKQTDRASSSPLPQGFGLFSQLRRPVKKLEGLRVCTAEAVALAVEAFAEEDGDSSEEARTMASTIVDILASMIKKEAHRRELMSKE